MNKKTKQSVTSPECRKGMLAINDTLELLSGKWKIKIIAALMKNERLFFMELLREVDGIGAKMLSKDLNVLETNRLLTRTVCNSKPVTVAYELTAHGRSMSTVIDAIEEWGLTHRKFVLELVNPAPLQ
jgi:DNA-binding HxlR family transcriptional regulator